MGIGKSNKSKKDKDKKNAGPKGKKARAKAKLDNKWGEHAAADDDNDEPKKTRRVGKSRLLSKGGKYGQGNKKTGVVKNISNEGVEGFYSRIHEVQRDKRLKQKSKLTYRQITRRALRQQQQQTDENDDENDDEASASSSGSDNDDQSQTSMNDDENKNPMHDLLSMIRKNKNDDEEEDDDSDDEEDEEKDPENEDSDDENDDDEMIVDDIDVVDDNDDASSKNSKEKKIDTDLFRKRFNRLPLTKSELLLVAPASVAKANQKKSKPAMTKISVPSSNVEMQFLSSPFKQQPAAAAAIDGNATIDRNDDDDNGDVTSMCDDLLTLATTGEGSSNKSTTAVVTTTTPGMWQSNAMEVYNSDSTRDVLRKNWIGSSGKKIMSDIQAPVYSFLTRYADTLVTTNNGKSMKHDRKQQNDIHQLYLLHVLNHVLTSRSRIGRNNRYLKAKELKEALKKKKKKEVEDEKKSDTIEADDDDDEDDDDDDEEHRDVRDQGFTRPTVLVLLPTRGTCYTFIKNLYQMTGQTMDKEQEERFETDYGEIPLDDDDEDDNDDDDEENDTRIQKRKQNAHASTTTAAKKAAERERRRKAVLENKGKEWNELFGDTANQDDDFKIGISLIPKAASANANNAATKDGGKKNQQQQQQQQQVSNVAVKCYTDFFKSDIIVASPLGLKMLLTPDAGDDEDDDDDDDNNKNSGRSKSKSSSFDYLSSIEICLLQHAEIILMQNWDHVNDILSALNQEPVNNNSTDFSRVRNYLLEDTTNGDSNGEITGQHHKQTTTQGQYWRQLIISSKFMDPSLISSFKRHSKSLSGQVRLRRKIKDSDASISNVLVPMKQVFQTIPTGSFHQQSKARVDYFVKNLLPLIQRNEQTHTLVFIPSYFDFCALRNTLLKQELSKLFVTVSEYSRTTEIGRGRARFLQGRKPLMLYTGRSHFFHRHAMKGVKNLIFLGLPEHPEFYSDYVNLITAVSGNNNDDDRMLLDDGSNNNNNHNKDTSCIALFTKYEAHALERVVGSNNCNRMMSSNNTAFMFYS